MPKYIIVGYYEENGQSFADSQEAEDAFKAFAKTAKAYTEGDLVLVQAVQLPDGECFSPCDNNGDTCFACDYPVEDWTDEEIVAACETAYNNDGASGVVGWIDARLGDDPRISTKHCDGCEDDTPSLNGSCLVCGGSV